MPASINCCKADVLCRKNGIWCDTNAMLARPGLDGCLELNSASIVWFQALLWEKVRSWYQMILTLFFGQDPGRDTVWEFLQNGRFETCFPFIEPPTHWNPGFFRRPTRSDSCAAGLRNIESFGNSGGVFIPAVFAMKTFLASSVTHCFKHYWNDSKKGWSSCWKQKAWPCRNRSNGVKETTWLKESSWFFPFSTWPGRSWSQVTRMSGIWGMDCPCMDVPLFGLSRWMAHILNISKTNSSNDLRINHTSFFLPLLCRRLPPIC